MSTMTDLERRTAPPPVDQPVVDVVVPVYNEAHVLDASIAPPARTTSRPASRSRWRITIVDNASTDDTLGRRRGLAAELDGSAPCTSIARAGAWRCARPGATSDAAVVAYMDVDLSTGLDALLAPRGPAGVGPLRPGHRLPAGPRRRRGPRPEAGADLAHLQPAPAHGVRHPASATRSAASRRCGPTSPGGCSRRRRRRLVLRHRAAAAGRAQRPAHPRGAGRLGRRPRQPRATSPAPRWTTCGAWPGWLGGSPPAAATSSWPGRRGRCSPTTWAEGSWPSPSSAG